MPENVSLNLEINVLSLFCFSIIANTNRFHSNQKMRMAPAKLAEIMCGVVKEYSSVIAILLISSTLESSRA